MLLKIIEIDIFNLVLENAKVSIKYKGNIKLVHIFNVICIFISNIFILLSSN